MLFFVISNTKKRTRKILIDANSTTGHCST